MSNVPFEYVPNEEERDKVIAHNYTYPGITGEGVTEDEAVQNLTDYIGAIFQSIITQQEILDDIEVWHE